MPQPRNKLNDPVDVGQYASTSTGMLQAQPEAPSLKEKLFKALSEAYRGNAVSITDYQPGHSKLAARRLVHPHIGVRVRFEPADSAHYAIAGMLLADASDKDVTELMARLADDYRRAEDAATPKKPV